MAYLDLKRESNLDTLDGLRAEHVVSQQLHGEAQRLPDLESLREQPRLESSRGEKISAAMLLLRVEIVSVLVTFLFF